MPAPLSIRDRCEALAQACAAFPWLGVGGANDLLELIRQDLGSESALAEGIERGGIRSRAIPPAITLHIVSGNTPHAALQSLTRGLLLGGAHRLKLPSNGLTEAEQFLRLLPPELAETVTVSNERRPDWVEEVDCIVVFGSDETLAAVHASSRPNQRFIAHGHKMGFGFITETWTQETIAAAAKDVCAFNQLGCLSPVAYFVEREPSRFAAELAGAMEKAESIAPRGEIATSAALSISSMRNELKFRERTERNCRVWQSEGSTAWTVVYDESADFPRTPLHRFIPVKPMPDIHRYFDGRQRYLSSAGTNSKSAEFREDLIRAGFQRVCALGSMQEPGLLWHHDGYAPLGSRVKWVDSEL